jgi:hypothetical protein
LDAVLHAEHKETLEEMRAYYMLRGKEEDENDQTSTVSDRDQAAVNGKGSGLFGKSGDDENGASSFLLRSLDWRTLLGLSPDPVTPTRYTNVRSLYSPII